MKDLSGRLKGVIQKAKRGLFGEPVDLKAVFVDFKAVLESNNKALEVITDMGEKLGGEYIFDINYIKKAYSELYDNIHNSVEEFNSLARGKYQIAQTFERIDSAIKKALYEEAPVYAGQVIFYGDITWEAAREVGGKNYHLSQLGNSLDVKVPEGFAITAHAYDEFIRHNGLDKRIEELNSRQYSDDDLKEIMDAINGGSFPEQLEAAIDEAIEKLRGMCGPGIFIAVRSSAEEEDGDYSFAGQFETVLNVPLEGKAVKEAYREVISSLFIPASVAYQKRLGYEPGGMRMPVGCVRMIDAVASGVAYTADPATGKERLTINATWGLCESVVEGKVDPDVYIVERGSSGKDIEVRPGKKESMVVSSKAGGTEDEATPEDMRAKVCLTEAQIHELAGRALQIEKYFRRPQDIEWALDTSGTLYIIQARPLRAEAAEEPGKRISLSEITGKYRPLIHNKGYVVQKGIAGGKVFIVKSPDDIGKLPKGAVLVAKNDSPQFVRAMPYASAIITDTGSTTSHMASICREFKIPSVVNTREATRLLSDGQEITLYIDEDGNFSVYDGLVEEILVHMDKAGRSLEELYEYRKKKFIMRFIAPLNLVNPLADEFTPEKCKTMHDVLRFIHEKSVQGLIDASLKASGKGTLKGLELAVPAGISVIDMGDGLKPGSGAKVTLDEVQSEPLRAVAQGMIAPGAWHSEAVALHTTDFLSSMMRMEDITLGGAGVNNRNVAVISKEYLNLTLRFGYHFNLLDCFCTEKAAYNHIYFRFVGGATDISKRSRRIQLIAEILKDFGFMSSTKGDLIIARLSHIEKEDALKVLDMAGRLIAYTRQLDAVLNSDGDIEKYRKAFLEGDYKLD